MLLELTEFNPYDPESRDMHVLVNEDMDLARPVTELRKGELLVGKENRFRVTQIITKTGRGINVLETPSEINQRIAALRTTIRIDDR